MLRERAECQLAVGRRRSIASADRASVPRRPRSRGAGRRRGLPGQSVQPELVAGSGFAVNPGCHDGIMAAMDEDLFDPDFLAWVRLTPAQRLEHSARLLKIYLALGGTLDPEPDPQSPFYGPPPRRARPAHGRSGVRAVGGRGVHARQRLPRRRG
jgi:hypothetical protein